ncbi:YdeI/OmpD-associated family protein [Arachidicoccus sp.]|uniref:YdeI/OmpD-associated family protein n=1 Tax=Arachidicoccus sp. TaxID=1872624 RepID=UPI003D2004C4
MEKIKTYIFSAAIDLIGINPFVYLPEHILNAIFIQANKKKGPIPVKGTINGSPYKQTLIKYSGQWRLYINTIMLKNSPKRIGEIIEVSILLDKQSREIPMLMEFAAALELDKEAKLIFEKLSTSRKSEILRNLTRLKTKESLERNIVRAITFLNGKGSFIGRQKP